MLVPPQMTVSAVLRGGRGPVVPQEDVLGGPAMEMRFSLPAGASPATLELLVGAGAEVQRAGAVAPPSVALPLLEWELGAAVLSYLKSAFCCRSHPTLSFLLVLNVSMRVIRVLQGCKLFRLPFIPNHSTTSNFGSFTSAY